MANWKELETEICNWLKSLKTANLQFRNSYQAIPGFPSNGFRSDGLLTDGKTLLAVEVEAGQMHPDTNVGKYWLLHEEFEAYEQIFLFHIYTPDFDSYEWRLRLGEFYASKMKAILPFTYFFMDFRSEHIANYDKVLHQIKEKVFPVIKEYLLEM